MDELWSLRQNQHRSDSFFLKPGLPPAMMADWSVASIADMLAPPVFRHFDAVFAGRRGGGCRAVAAASTFARAGRVRDSVAVGVCAPHPMQQALERIFKSVAVPRCSSFVSMMMLARWIFRRESDHPHCPPKCV